MYILRKENQERSTWSGGTTTQLMIWPLDSAYKALNFDWRISTATVEVDHSTFTELPNINRVIMSLDGPLTLVHHENRVDLKPFESFTFDGGLSTESFNQVTDFNVMTSQQFKSSMTKIDGTSQEQYHLSKHQGLYVLSGSCVCEGESFHQHDFIFVWDEMKEVVVDKAFEGILIKIEEK